MFIARPNAKCPPVLKSIFIFLTLTPSLVINHPGSCAMSIFYLSLMGLLMIANMAMSQEQLAEQPAEQQFCPRASAENPRCISHRYEIREI